MHIFFKLEQANEAKLRTNSKVKPSTRRR